MFFKITASAEPYVYYGKYRDVDIQQLRIQLYQCYRRFVKCLAPPGKVQCVDNAQRFISWMDLIIQDDHKIEIITEEEFDPKKNPPPIDNDVPKLRFHRQQDPLRLTAKRIKSVRNKIFYEQNKEEITQKVADNRYWETHKDRLNERLTCDCGGKYTRRNKATHMKSKKHLESLDN